MGKLIVTEFASLDGVMEAPGGEPGYAHAGWVAPYFDPGVGAFKLRETLDAEALLLGRRTYEGFAAAWPGREDPDGFADKMNAMPKHVVSATLTGLEWGNSHLLRGDLGAAVTQLKQDTAGDVLVAGSGTLVHALFGLGLVDQLNLVVFPVVLGSGMRWFPEQPDTQPLTLVESTPYGSGAVGQIYTAA